MKSMIVERFIRTLRIMLSKVLYGLYGKTEGRHTNILDKVIDRYNDTAHKGIDYNKPSDIFRGKMEISRTFKYKSYFDFKPFYKKGSILNEQNKVRVAQLKSKFEKESTLKWSKEIFFVKRVRLTDPITYILEDKKKEMLSGVFIGKNCKKYKVLTL